VNIAVRGLLAQQAGRLLFTLAIGNECRLVALMTGRDCITYDGETDQPTNHPTRITVTHSVRQKKKKLVWSVLLLPVTSGLLHGCCWGLVLELGV
jgi:hypothetical protein